MLLLCRLKVLLTRQYFALEDEDLDSDKTVCCHGFSKSIIYIGAESVQRYAAFTIPLRTRHFSTTKTAGAGDPDALGAELESRGHALFHGPSESNPALKLESYVLSYELSIEFRLTNLMNIDKENASNSSLQGRQWPGGTHGVNLNGASGRVARVELRRAKRS